MHARSPLALYATLAGLVLCVTASSAHAQQALAPRTPITDVAARPASLLADSAVTETRAAGPTNDAARIAVSHPTSHELKISSAAQRRAGLGQPIALMVVGGALVGLYGLYEYLQ